MQYALLIYGQSADPPGPMTDDIAVRLARPHVRGWARLFGDGSATTLRDDGRRMLLTDGPFIDSKEYLAGLIVVEAEDLDGALEIARDFQDTRTGGSIEVRPIYEGLFGGP